MLSAENSLHRILSEVSKTSESLENLEIKNLVIVYGNFGSGKSTTINYLLGKN